MPFFFKSIFQKTLRCSLDFRPYFQKTWFFALGAKLRPVEVRQGKKRIVL